MPTSKQKHRFILPSMEMATSYPFAVPLRNYTSEETAKAILSIISILGAPIVILSDQGSNFLSVTLNHLDKKFGISKIKTSACHPQSHGKLKRFHSSMKTMLSKCIDAKQDWPMALDLVYISVEIYHNQDRVSFHRSYFSSNQPPISYQH